MEKIPTAEELLANNIDGLRDIIDDEDLFIFYKGVICEFAKELAKLHVEQALKEAARNVVCYNYSVDEHSILKSYPLDKIK